MVPNEVVSDPGISDQAQRCWAALRTCLAVLGPEKTTNRDIAVQAGWVSKRTGEPNREKVRVALLELEAAGYLERANAGRDRGNARETLRLLPVGTCDLGDPARDLGEGVPEMSGTPAPDYGEGVALISGRGYPTSRGGGSPDLGEGVPDISGRFSTEVQMGQGREAREESNKESDKESGKSMVSGPAHASDAELASLLDWAESLGNSSDGMPWREWAAGQCGYHTPRWWVWTLLYRKVAGAARPPGGRLLTKIIGDWRIAGRAEMQPVPEPWSLPEPASDAATPSGAVAIPYAPRLSAADAKRERFVAKIQARIDAQKKASGE